jgi:hypothetical protein
LAGQKARSAVQPQIDGSSGGCSTAVMASSIVGNGTVPATSTLPCMKLVNRHNVFLSDPRMMRGYTDRVNIILPRLFKSCLKSLQSTHRRSCVGRDVVHFPASYEPHVRVVLRSRFSSFKSIQHRHPMSTTVHRCFSSNTRYTKSLNFSRETRSQLKGRQGASMCHGHYQTSGGWTHRPNCQASTHTQSLGIINVPSTYRVLQ